MLLDTVKKRSINRRIKDFKHSQTHCHHCGKSLERMSLAFDGQLINKSTISLLEKSIDERPWSEIKKELVALCRFCGEIYNHPTLNYFDIKMFNQYLMEHSDMSRSTIREYVVRLRRLDNMMLNNEFELNIEPVKHHGNMIGFIEKHSNELHSNYRIALRKYKQFLEWQQDNIKQRAIAG